MQRRIDHSADLHRACAELGIETRYHSHGVERRVPERTLHALCDVLRTASDGQPILPACIVVDASQHIRVPLHLVSARRARWKLREENGRTHRGDLRAAAGSSFLDLPRSLPPGYHRLEVAWSGGEAGCTIIAGPPRAYIPPRLRQGKIWGIAAQLYALRSSRNWGVGDVGDLEALIPRVAATGADVVGINPLHALFPDQPDRASPYSPSSRLFLNALYLDIEAIEDFVECPAAQHLAGSPDVIAAKQKARTATLVDYPTVTRLKRQALEVIYQSFRARHLGHIDDPRGAQFRAYQREAGAPLRRFAIFHALRESFAERRQARSWRDWPAELRDPSSAAVAEFTRHHVVKIESIEYQQWQLSRQLARAARGARDHAMAIGLYQDLAVGFDPDGADAWAFQDVVAQGWTIGAPPDAWSPKGQDWGLSPLNPQRLRQAAYGPFIATLRANMRHAGALRIDHILGLKRFFWVPQGGSPADGAYVRYPFTDLLGIVALESVRQRCIVVGEDLGTVPPGFSETLQRRGMLSYRLLYFSRTTKGGFERSRDYPRRALAAISTHDLPTFVGYWRGHDIALRDRLKLYPEAGRARRDRAARAADRRALVKAFAAEKLAAGGGTAPVDAAHRFLARSPSRIVMAQIEDLLGVSEQVNVPGTVDQHPNWRRKLPLDLDAVFEDARFRRGAAALAEERPAPAAEMRAPRATYRLQLNHDFRFDAATAALPYLARLGISHVYLSPIFEAQPNSTHGYDTTSFDRLNPELGGETGFRALTAQARALGLKILVDFVPNHMGIGQARNEWWLDLLKRGQHSPAAEIFDVDWTPAAWPDLRGKLIVPLLGEPYEEALAGGRLQLRFDRAAGSLAVWYHEHCFPIRLADYPPKSGQRAVAAISRNPAALADLLSRQIYRLTFWRDAGRRVNYRRFFDINQLASLRMERPKVFERCHRLLAKLVADGLVHGIRLDHVDGLYDPGEYCHRLRSLVDRRRRQPFYIVVEKILGTDETLRDWPVDGTTGYEFANWINGVLIDPSGADALTRTYHRFTGCTGSFQQELRKAKQQVLTQLFGGELTMLAARAARLTPHGFNLTDLQAAIRDVIVAFPIYRTYFGQHGGTAKDINTISAAVAGVGDIRVRRFVRSLLTTRLAARSPPRQRAEIRDVAVRFQQLTAPVQAKALEDTAFYRYTRLLSLNEVGGDPGQFGIAAAAFHARMQAQARHWPHSLVATATHDTKRGEDSRARISVLSEIPQRWDKQVSHWASLNRSALGEADGERAPSPNDEYIIYQSLLGAWPMACTSGPPDPPALASLRERMTAYVRKAVREAKLRSSWLEPNAEYEAACQRFVECLLDPVRSRRFLADFGTLAADVARCGALSSLSQTTLKLTVPGVPDIYRGCELWDLSLVDPDNRRPLPLDERRHQLEDLAAGEKPELSQLAADWRSGRIKLYLTWRLLALRRAQTKLFANGNYVPLRVSGPAADHVIAFERRYRATSVVVAVGRWFATLPAKHGTFSPQPAAWSGTRLSGARERACAVDLLTGRPVDDRFLLEDLFRDLPIAVISAAP